MARQHPTLSSIIGHQHTSPKLSPTRHLIPYTMRSAQTMHSSRVMTKTARGLRDRLGAVTSSAGDDTGGNDAEIAGVSDDTGCEGTPQMQKRTPAKSAFAVFLMFFNDFLDIKLTFLSRFVAFSVFFSQLLDQSCTSVVLRTVCGQCFEVACPKDQENHLM